MTLHVCSINHVMATVYVLLCIINVSIDDYNVEAVNRTISGKVHLLIKCMYSSAQYNYNCIIIVVFNICLDNFVTLKSNV